MGFLRSLGFRGRLDPRGRCAYPDSILVDGEEANIAKSIGNRAVAHLLSVCAQGKNGPSGRGTITSPNRHVGGLDLFGTDVSMCFPH